MTTSVSNDTKPGNRFDLAELSGAFGDLGTLIPFIVAYVSLLKMDPTGILLGFGVALIAVGFYYRTPFPVQPMKAIGTAAITQTAGAVMLTPSIVAGAGIATAFFWLVLALTGLARRLSLLIPKPVLIGIVMGLGFSFMREGIVMMGKNWWLAATLLGLTLYLLSRSRIPAMLMLLVIGMAAALFEQPALADSLAMIKPAFRLPDLAWSSVTWNDLWAGAILLALPQLPLTFGNALIAITEENNRLFPDRPVSERKVAFSTGLMNAWSSAVGGIPMCHGAGGMAGHVKFGAHTGGASIMLGGLLVVLAVFFGGSMMTIFQLFPAPVLGVILFLAGAELALGGRPHDQERGGRFVVLTTAVFAMWNVGVAVIFGALVYYASQREWIKM
ncbi:MAG: putative sulfate/molybdate transporter [Gallionella sp.]|jgi:MFS superfamily sulfate permease-like transporter